MAQREPSNFGDVNHGDFEPGPFPDASSVVLFDVASLYFEVLHGDVFPEFSRHVRVRINTREGFDKWGDFVLGNSNLRIKKIKAATYRIENGVVVTEELDKDKIFKNRRGTNEKIFSLPNLKEGSIVEVSYSGTFIENVSPNRIIQSDSPILWSEYRLGNTRPLTTVIYGGIRPVIHDEKFKGNQTRFVFKNVPAFVPEENMLSPIPYYARLEFSLPDQSWQYISGRYAFAMEVRQAPRALTKLVSDLTKGMTDDLQKAKAICQYIKMNFECDGIPGFRSLEFQEVLNQKRGSVGSINGLMHEMLREAGLNPTAILIRKRSYGQILKDAPTDEQFNYVVSRLTIGGRDYFLDATDPLLQFGVLPVECVNVEGMEASEKNPNWVWIEPAGMDKINVTARLTLTPELTLKGRVTVMSLGYVARDKRAELAKLGEEKFIAENPFTKPWENDSARIGNVKKLDAPFQEVYHTNIPGHVQGSERLYIDPYILLAERENRWPDAVRKYPIDLTTPSEKLLVVTLTIPEEYEVESVPTAETFSTPDNAIACGFKVLQNNNILVISFQQVTSRSLFPKENYAALREFFNRMIAKTNEPIVLRKKAGH